jgi:uncharacterized membrane protein YkoI
MLNFVYGLSACVLALCVTVTTSADEEKVALDKLPKAVLDTVKARFPKAELLGAAKEKEDGKILYEVAIKDQGAKIDVILTAEGAITLFEKEIAAKDLPKAVTKALEEKYPKAAYKKIEEVTKVENKSEKLAYYEVLLVTPAKKRGEVQVDASGKIVNEEQKKNDKDDGQKGNKDDGQKGNGQKGNKDDGEKGNKDDGQKNDK